MLNEYLDEYEADVSTEENNSSVESSSLNPTGQRLKAYIERVERLEEEKKNISEDVKEVFAEAKSDGFDVKTMKKIVSIRKKDANEVAEEEAILETYKNALGML